MARLLAFVSVFVESPLMDYVVRELSKIPSMEELYEVTGEADIVCLISASDIEEFRELLVNTIMKTKGVRTTVTDIVLSSYAARPTNTGEV